MWSIYLISIFNRKIQSQTNHSLIKRTGNMVSKRTPPIQFNNLNSDKVKKRHPKKKKSGASETDPLRIPDKSYTLVVHKKKRTKKYRKTILISKTHSFTVLFQSKSTHNFQFYRHEQWALHRFSHSRAFCLISALKMYRSKHCICQISHTNAEHMSSTVHTIY